MQKYLITDELSAIEKGYTFADEADMLNVALLERKHENGEMNILLKHRWVRILEIMLRLRN